MPELDYAKENAKVSKVDYNFPKLSLKKDEKARILLIEKNPVYEWTHELKRPKIVDGEPAMEMTTPLRGEPKQVNTMEFLSRPICLGDAGTLDNDGYDPANCPMCALAKRNPDAVKAPARRFATHVIRYRTQGGKFDLLNPFAVEVLVWSFTERMFAQLAEFKEEWDDLRAHDLLVECKNQNFQNYEINVAKSAAWLEDEERKALVKSTYAGGRIEDLTIACGRATERRWIDSDIEKIEEAWAQVAQFTRTSSNFKSAAGDIDALAAEEKKWAKEAPAADEAPTKPEPKVDAAVDELDALTAPTAETPVDSSAIDDLDNIEASPAKEKPKAEAKAPTVSVEDDLDALLGA